MISVKPAPWTEHASCAGLPADAFFMGDTEDMDITERNEVQAEYRERLRILRPICAGCSVWQECRVSSIGEEGGTWAGVTETRRHRARRAFFPTWSVEELQAATARALADHTPGADLAPALEAEGLSVVDFFTDFDTYAKRLKRTPGTAFQPGHTPWNKPLEEGDAA